MRIAILVAGHVGLAIALASVGRPKVIKYEPVAEWQDNKVHGQLEWTRRNKSDRKRNKAGRWR